MHRRIALQSIIMVLVGTAAVCAGMLMAGDPRPRSLLAGDSLHDFGVVKVDGESAIELNWDFVLTNTSGRPLTLYSVSSTCGCLAGTPEQSQYEPGESARIPIIMKVHGSGVLRHAITLNFGAQGMHQLVVQATGRQQRMLKAVPSFIVLRDEKADVTLHYLDYDSDEEPVTPSLIESPELSINGFSGWNLLTPRDAEAGVPARWEGVCSLNRLVTTADRPRLCESAHLRVGHVTIELHAREE